MSQSKGKTWPLRNVPIDIQTIVIREQAKLKEKCSCQKSIETTIYSIIRKLSDGKQE